jgi:RNA polymerase sigma-70 factor (ECF subfamily)
MGGIVAWSSPGCKSELEKFKCFFACNRILMPRVSKDVAANASAISVPLTHRGKGEEDRELVRLAQQGDEPAFEELVRRHQHRVASLVGGILRRREDVEDVVQQVFLKVFVSLKRFDQRSAFSTWLYKISVNECWDYLRKKKVRPLVYEADLSEEQVSRLDGIVSASRPVEGPSERAEIKQLLDWMLEKLPENDRELLLLKEVEGFSVQELAEILDLNVNTVKVRLFRARGRLMDVYRRRMAPGSQRESPATQERKDSDSNA